VKNTHRCGILLLCCCMLLALVPHFSAQAAGDVIFTAVENVFDRDLSPDTMPFVYKGDIYVEYTAFSGISDLRLYHNTRLQQLILYNMNERLIFDLKNQHSYIMDGTFFPLQAIMRNGHVFVPVRIVCQVFDYYYAYITEDVIAPIIRINSAPPVETTEYFVSRCSILMKTIYDNYQAKLRQPAVTPPPEVPVTPTTPIAPETPDDPQQRQYYLTFEGDLTQEGARIAQTLGTYNVPAAFFVTAEQMRTSADMLRQLYAAGHSIGILLAEVPEDDAALQTALTQANDTLKAVLLTRTRLVRVQGGTAQLNESQQALAQQLGYLLWDADVDPYANTRQTAYRRLQTLAPRVSQLCCIRLLPDAQTTDNLRSILSYLRSNSFTALPMHEWSAPIRVED